MNAGKIEIENKYDFTNLEKFDIGWTVMRNGMTVESGTVASLFLEANGKTTLTVPYKTRIEAGSEYFLKMCIRDRSQALLAIEGCNEPNNWDVKYKGKKGGANASWLPVAELHRDLYTAVKKDEILKDYPVWSTTETGAQTDNCGLQYLTIPAGANTLMPDGTQYADVACCHNYFVHPGFPPVQNNQTWVASVSYTHLAVVVHYLY